jgi:hypothetical protein
MPTEIRVQVVTWRRSQVAENKRWATLAQLVERLIRNQQVAGSIPAGGSMLNALFSINYRLLIAVLRIP